MPNFYFHRFSTAFFALFFFGIFPTFSMAQNNSSSSTTAPSAMAQNTGLDTMFLIKTHAVLMILAWLAFAPLAILFARFQRDPLRRLFGEQLWFQFHRLSNTFTLVCVLLALICILSAMGGRWVGPTAWNGFANVNWGSIHALFGLIAVLLAISQPMTALFRCHPDSSSRQIFNIWHGTSGYLAWLCAAVALTIACLTFHSFASPTAASILIWAYLAFLLICFCLMQFLAIQKARLQIVEWIGQGQLFCAAAVICVGFALAIALLVIFA